MQISALMVRLMICPANQTAPPQIRFLQTNIPNARLTIFYMSLYQIRFFQHTEGTSIVSQGSQKDFFHQQKLHAVARQRQIRAENTSYLDVMAVRANKQL